MFKIIFNNNNNKILHIDFTLGAVLTKMFYKVMVHFPAPLKITQKGRMKFCFHTEFSMKGEQHRKAQAVGVK